MSCRDCFDIFDVKLTFALFSQKFSCDLDLLSIWVILLLHLKWCICHHFKKLVSKQKPLSQR